MDNGALKQEVSSAVGDTQELGGPSQPMGGDAGQRSGKERPKESEIKQSSSVQKDSQMSSAKRKRHLVPEDD